MEAEAEREPTARGRFLAPWILWLAGSLLAFYPALLSGFEQLQIQHGDPRLVHYILEHSYRWVAGFAGHGSFWSPPVYYPAPDIGAYSDTMLGAAPLYWLWRGLGLGTGASFQLWMMTVLGLTYFFTYAWLRRGLEQRPWPAAVGAFLFAFGISRLANFNSPQLLPLMYAALALYAAGRALPRRADEPAGHGAWVVLFFVALALHAWSAFYPAFFLAFVLAVATVVGLAFPESRARLLAVLRGRPAAVVLGLLACAGLLVPLASAYLGVAETTGMREYTVVEASLPQLSSWVFPGPRHWLYGGLAGSAPFSYTGPVAPHSNGLGFVTTLLCLAGLVAARGRPVARVALASTAVVVLLATDFWGVSAWRLVYEAVPGAGAIRFVARIGMYLSLAGAVGAALLLGRLEQRGKPVLALVLGLVMVAEQGQVLGARDDARYVECVRAAAERVDPGAEAFLVTTRGAGQRERPQPLRYTQVLAMWIGAEAGVPTLNGFYGNSPPGWNLSGVDARGARDEQRIERALEDWVRGNGLDAARVQRLVLEPADQPWNRAQSSSLPR